MLESCSLGTFNGLSPKAKASFASRRKGWKWLHRLEEYIPLLRRIEKIFFHRPRFEKSLCKEDLDKHVVRIEKILAAIEDEPDHFLGALTRNDQAFLLRAYLLRKSDSRLEYLFNKLEEQGFIISDEPSAPSELATEIDSYVKALYDDFPETHDELASVFSWKMCRPFELGDFPDVLNPSSSLLVRLEKVVKNKKDCEHRNRNELFLSDSDWLCLFSAVESYLALSDDQRAKVPKTLRSKFIGLGLGPKKLNQLKPDQIWQFSEYLAGAKLQKFDLAGWASEVQKCLEPIQAPRLVPIFSKKSGILELSKEQNEIMTILSKLRVQKQSLSKGERQQIIQHLKNGVSLGFFAKIDSLHFFRAAWKCDGSFYNWDSVPREWTGSSEEKQAEQDLMWLFQHGKYFYRQFRDRLAKKHSEEEWETLVNTFLLRIIGTPCDGEERAVEKILVLIQDQAPAANSEIMNALRTKKPDQETSKWVVNIDEWELSKHAYQLYLANRYLGIEVDDTYLDLADDLVQKGLLPEAAEHGGYRLLSKESELDELLCQKLSILPNSFRNCCCPLLLRDASDSFVIGLGKLCDHEGVLNAIFQKGLDGIDASDMEILRSLKDVYEIFQRRTDDDRCLIDSLKAKKGKEFTQLLSNLDRYGFLFTAGEMIVPKIIFKKVKKLNEIALESTPPIPEIRKLSLEEVRFVRSLKENPNKEGAIEKVVSDFYDKFISIPRKESLTVSVSTIGHTADRKPVSGLMGLVQRISEFLCPESHMNFVISDPKEKRFRLAGIGEGGVYKTDKELHQALHISNFAINTLRLIPKSPKTTVDHKKFHDTFMKELEGRLSTDSDSPGGLTNVGLFTGGHFQQVLKWLDVFSLREIFVENIKIRKGKKVFCSQYVFTCIVNATVATCEALDIPPPKYATFFGLLPGKSVAAMSPTEVRRHLVKCGILIPQANPLRMICKT